MDISTYWLAAISGMGGYHLARAIRFTSRSDCIVMGLAVGAIFSAALFIAAGLQFRLGLLLSVMVTGAVGGWLGFQRRRAVERRRSDNRGPER